MLEKREREKTKHLLKMSASIPHILISMEEYDRLKEIESQYEQIHKGIQKDLQIPSNFLCFCFDLIF
jgi:hypothetical protein